MRGFSDVLRRTDEDDPCLWKMDLSPDIGGQVFQKHPLVILRNWTKILYIFTIGYLFSNETFYFGQLWRIDIFMKKNLDSLNVHTWNKWARDKYEKFFSESESLFWYLGHNYKYRVGMQIASRLSMNSLRSSSSPAPLPGIFRTLLKKTPIHITGKLPALDATEKLFSKENTVTADF